MVWFTGLAGRNKIGSVAANGEITEYSVPSEGTGIAGVTVRPKDGNVWFTENDAGYVGSMTTSGGQIRLYTDGSYPIGIAIGPDGNVWVTESQSNAIGRIEVHG